MSPKPNTGHSHSPSSARANGPGVPDTDPEFRLGRGRNEPQRTQDAATAPTRLEVGPFAIDLLENGEPTVQEFPDVRTPEFLRLLNADEPKTTVEFAAALGRDYGAWREQALRHVQSARGGQANAAAAVQRRAQIGEEAAREPRPMPAFQGAFSPAAPASQPQPQPSPSQPASGREGALASPALRYPSVPPVASGSIASQIFRKQALRAYEEGERLTTALRATPPSTWIAVTGILAAVLSAVVVCWLCSIDIIARGPGILRTPDGPRVVASPLSGSVETVAVATGSEVHAGQPIATIGSTELQAQLLQAQRRLEQAERRLARHRSADAAMFQQSVDLLRQDQALTRQRIRSQQQTLSTLAEQEDALRELSGQGIVSRSSGRDAEERIREVERSRLALQQELTQGQIGLTAMQRERARELESLQAEYDAAAAAKDAIELMLERSHVVALQSGHVESVVIKPGELVQEGAPIATIVPLAAPTQVIAFIADRDRAFLVPGARARLELNQLPSGEFGTLKGRVTRIATGFASVEEMRSVLTDVTRIQELSYRVDISLDDDPAARSVLAKVRSGTLVTANVVTRSRRIITLLFDPLRPYFE
jgi:multidrug resistance efflux pump